MAVKSIIRALGDKRRKYMKSQFRLLIDTHNEAFEEPGLEVARILRELANKIERVGLGEYPLMDSNGNRVGECEHYS